MVARLWALTVRCCVVQLVLYVWDDQIGNGCVNCGNTWPDLFVNISIGVLCAGLAGWAMYRTRRIVDSFFLRKEMMHWAIMWSVILLISLPLEVIPYFRTLERDGWYNGGA